jgi:seryl-tRNA synthetase
MIADDRDGGSERAQETRRRHGDDFYARIGRKSWEVRRRALAGDADAVELLQRRREARARRKEAWHELLAAQEAATLLREELHSRIRANMDASRALSAEYFHYTERLRWELRAAEVRLAQLREEHDAIMQDLKVLPEARDS